MAAASAEDTTATFRRVYETLKADLLRDTSVNFNEDAVQWLDGMLDYNVLGGKFNRGLAVIESYKLLKAGSEPSEEEVFLACILGWGIEWLQAYFLVLDDIMDNSRTRQGKTYWYRLPKIEFKTTSGELLDLITTNERAGRSEQVYFGSLPTHCRIQNSLLFILFAGIKNTCPFYMFWQHSGYCFVIEFGFTSNEVLLSCYKVACALLLSGWSLDDYVKVKHILVEMGVYFQIQDDYLDCFGDPEVMGKIGTDIKDFKCSWLFVQALERIDEKQKDILLENYGKSDAACVAKVKDLYKELNLESMFSEYETEIYEKMISDIDTQPNEALQAVLKSFLHKIYRRRK